MKQYVVDAFTDRVFHGNQAAVCVLDAWLPEELMMNITRENNFSETAFTVREGEKWHLRWFTPGGEIDLCGHATLGTAFVLLNYYEKDAQQVVFTTLSGDLIVTRKGELYEMEFPAYELKKVDVTAARENALGTSVKEAYRAGLEARSGKDQTDRRPAGARHRPGQGRGLRLPQLRAEALRGGGPGLRLRPLPHHPLLGRSAGQGRAGGLSGVQTRRHALLPPGGKQNLHGWEGSPVFH